MKQKSVSVATIGYMEDDTQKPDSDNRPTIKVVQTPLTGGHHPVHKEKKGVVTGPSAPASAEEPEPPTHTKLQQLKHWLGEKLTQKEFVIGSIVFVLLLGSGIALGLSGDVSAPNPKPQPPAPVIKPVAYYSPLTGLPVAKKSATTLPVTGVMVENSDFARPQSGLSQAGVVFEALAEGGITRFLALYQQGTVPSIGPIRSARPYFIDWLLPFHAGYAHVGGSPTALADITSLHVKDMNEFYNASSYHRISSRDAPHNVYTSLATLEALQRSKGWTTSVFTGFPRKPDSPSKKPTATSIDYAMSTSDMEVHYQYSPKHNTYKRSEGGAPMTDATTGQQLDPKVVIAMVVPWEDGALDSSDAYYTVYSDIGTGTAYVFQDGTVTKGTWTKSSKTSQLEFKTNSGATLKLNAGQTWITAVGSASDVSYKT